VRLAPPEEFFKSIFTWSSDRLRQLQNARFAEVVLAAWETDFYRRLWGAEGIEPGDIRSLDDLRQLPTFDVGDFRAGIEESPPLGVHTVSSLTDSATAPYRVFTSGGTTGAPRVMSYSPPEWRDYVITLARCLYAHGVRAGDVVQIPMTFGMHVGAFAIYHALVDELRATPVTTSSGLVTPTRRQLDLAAQLGVNAIVGFPDYMLHLAEQLRTEGVDPRTAIPTLRSFTVAGDPTRVEAAWGRPAYDFFGASEYGMVGCQLPGEAGMRFWDDAAVVELLDPATGDSIDTADTLGALVVTSLFRKASPLIRFDTHDLTRRLVPDEQAETTLTYLDHHKGRSDGMIRIRGVNIWPEACAEVVRGQTGLNGQYFCVIESSGSPPRDTMTLMAEAAEVSLDLGSLATALESALRDAFDVRISVEILEPGALTELTGYGIDNKIRRFEDRRRPVSTSR
jgi:phenylacetate-CoA ligase